MNKFLRFERKYLPNVYRKNWYKALKAILLFGPMIPFIILFYYTKRLFKYIISKMNFKRNGKPDIKLQNIIAGWANLAFTDPNVEQVAIKRAEICAQCPKAEMVGGIHTIVVDNKTTQVRGLKCTECGCPISAKIRAMQDRCPLGKW
jgi:hypothetical protein